MRGLLSLGMQCFQNATPLTSPVCSRYASDKHALPSTNRCANLKTFGINFTDTSLKHSISKNPFLVAIRRVKIFNARFVSASYLLMNLDRLIKFSQSMSLSLSSLSWYSKRPNLTIHEWLEVTQAFKLDTANLGDITAI